MKDEDASNKSQYSYKVLGIDVKINSKDFWEISIIDLLMHI